VEKGHAQRSGQTRFVSALAMSEAIEEALAKLGVPIDTNSLHTLLKSPTQKLDAFKATLTERMQQKLAQVELQRNDKDALALQCRLGALPYQKATLTHRSRRPLFFGMTIASLLLFALGLFLLPWSQPAPTPALPSAIVEETASLEIHNESVAIDEEPAPPLAMHEAPQDPPPPPKTEQALKVPIFRTVEITVWPFADISLNGNLIARDTKNVILKLEAGTHKFTFTHTYAATVLKTIKLTENGPPIEINVKLDKSKPAYLVVKCNVNGDVAVDRSYRGTAKKSLTEAIVIPMPDKSHAQQKEVIVSQEGYEPSILTIEFVAGQTKEIDVTLKPIREEAKIIEAEPTPAIKKLY
jgi:hypothetical protein